MALSSQQVAEIIRDDEGFVRQICPDTIQDVDGVEIFSIPRTSFTAYRLLHASPVELSLSSKVLLLGGIPSHWVREQLKGFWRAAYRTSRRRLRAHADRLLSHGYREAYRSKKPRNRRVSLTDTHKKPEVFADTKHQSSSASLRSSKGLSTRVSSISVDSQKSFRRRSYTMTGLSKRKASLKKSGRIQGNIPRVLPRGKTLAFIPKSHESKSPDISGFSTDDISKLTSRSTDDIYSLRSFENEKFKQLAAYRNSNRSGISKLGPDSPKRLKDSKESLHYSAFDAKRKITEQEDGEKHRSVELESIDSDDLDKEPLSGIVSTMALTRLSFIDTTNASNSTSPGQEVRGSRIRFADQTHQNQARMLFKGKRGQIVRLKPTCNSKDSEPLRIMVPEPAEPINRPAKQISHKILKRDSIVVRRVGNMGHSARFTMKGVLDLFGTDYSLISPSLKKLKGGRIILMEKMLVMVKTAVEKRDPVLCFSQEEPIDTRVSERWKEYIVVARSTGKGDTPILLQFYRSRHISDGQKKITYGTSLDFELDKHCLVGIYGSLDKSIYIQKPIKKDYYGTAEDPPGYTEFDPLRIYILKCSTLKSSGKWYNLLKGAVKIRDKLTEMTIKVPEAEISVDIKLRDRLIGGLIDLEQNVEDLKICSLERGYKVLPHPLMRFLTVTILEELKKAGLHKVIQKWQQANTILGCNYKYYDLLQWCSNSSSSTFMEILPLFKSFLLEFRPYVPSPREIFIEDEGVLVEPVPIEGFLLKLTNRRGKEKRRLKKLYFKPSYFFTNDNLMFFTSSFKAHPPLPKNATDLKLAEKDKTFDFLPQVYEQDPYPLDLSSHIRWLRKDMTAEEFESNDLNASKCFGRRVDQILKAEGVIDVCEIEKVYQGSKSDVKGSELKFQILHLAKRSFWHDQTDDIESMVTSVLYIATRNNLFVTLLAPNPKICNEWVIRLKSLASYWKAKRACDIKIMRELKFRNMEHLKMTNIGESNINDATPKWILDRGFSDTTIYNANALCQIRPLIHQGVLYQKPKKHSTFTKYLVVLIPGYLIFYKPKRTKSGFPKEVIDHKHYLTISIADCYLYSGSTSKLDLLNRSNKSEDLNPLSKALPRLYSDGWRSSEEEATRCFTLWFGRKRAILAKRSHSESAQGENKEQKVTHHHNKGLEGNPNVLRTVSRLGVSGKSMVFMTRSRQERNLWLLSISSEIERLKRHSTSFL